MSNLLLPPIRIAVPSDATQIAQIYALNVQDTAFTFEVEPPTAVEMQRRMQKISERLPWLVMDLEGQIAGYAYASPHRERAAYQWAVEVSVYVAPKAYRQGVARALYKSLLQILEAQGFYKVYAGITLPNNPSVNLHESFGFELIGTYQDVGYKLGRWHNVGWWQLTLKPPLAQPEPPSSFNQLLQRSNNE